MSLALEGIGSSRKSVYRSILITASLGGLSFMAFNNGLLLAYFSRLGIKSSQILLLLALPAIFQFMLIIYFSYLSDWFGKKRVGAMGLIFSMCTFILFWQAGFMEKPFLLWMVVLGVVLFGIGTAMAFSNWFALLHPLVPEKTRGRFFGQLRLILQGFGFIFTLGVTYLLGNQSSLEIYHWVLGLLVACLLVRLPFFFEHSRG